MVHDTHEDDLMTLREVCEFTGRGRETIRRWVEKGLFPPPRGKIGPYRNSMLVWRRSDVLKWKADLEKKYPWKPPAPANDNDAPAANDNTPAIERRTSSED